LIEEQGKTAIILGATGLTGGKLLELLLNDNRYQRIKVFSRSGLGFQHTRIQEYLGDLANLKSFAEDFKGDEAFCCIGTTKSKTPDKEVYKNIDYGIPVNAAQLCKQSGIDTFIVISALGANSDSNIFYNRVKGEMEEAILKIGITKTHILQPSLIGGKRNEKRIGEWLFKKMMKVVNLVLVGSLEKYKSIEPRTIAKAMLWLANNHYENRRVTSDEIKKIAKGDRNRA